MDRDFKDHFSGNAAAYGRYRPHYPPELFSFLVAQCPVRELAWDCGCGNGQASVALADHFERVYATDASAEQIAKAKPHPKITYAVAPAEASGLPDRSVDLVTVAQAIHWFDFDAFYNEVRRVSKPDGLLAAISYGLFEIEPGLDERLHHLHRVTLGPHWPPERRHVDENLTTIPFPFEALETPRLSLKAAWNLDDLVGYIDTWSALQRYRAETGEDPLPATRDDLAQLWGDSAESKSVRWPLNVRLGRIV